MSPALAAMRALLECGSIAPACERLAAAGAQEAADLLAAHPEAERLLNALPDHRAAVDPADLAASFDRLVALSPEGAVALYSLGDPRLLDAATEEVLALLRTWRIPSPGARILELGCGIGRLLDRTGAIGLDISWGMLAEARRRSPAACLIQGSGREIPVADHALDLVLAVDAFPYIVLAGLASTLLAEIRRVLRPNSELVIFNYSYGDESELRNLAEAHGLRVMGGAERPFRIWDASAWRLRTRA